MSGGLKRLSGIKPRKGSSGLKKLGAKKVIAAPLAFLEKANPDDVTADTTGMTQEQAIDASVQILGTTMSQRMKMERERKKAATTADDYFVMCFQEGTQATAFLKAIGYPEIYASFVDGTIVAKLLDIELPEPTLKKRALKKTHDKGLTRLAADLKKK